MRLAAIATTLFLVAIVDAGEPAFVFRDAGESAGIFPAAEGIRGHGAAWGDVDGDGWLDLYVGTFGGGQAKNNLLLRNTKGKFTLDQQPQLRIPARATGALLADLDNDGDLDLYIGSMPQPKNELRGCSLFRNDGQGKFSDISEDNGACPAAFGGRSACVLDYDGDGLLDLLVGEDPLPGYNGSQTKSSRLFRNMGDLKFDDVSRAAGIPQGIPGLGVAAADVNGDTWPDVFLASHNGGNRLLVNERGKFREIESARETFHWSDAGGDNMVCGVCFGDVNRDGLLDIALGQHFDSPWRKPVASRLYLNRGIKSGDPVFEDITAATGLVPLAMKAPHVEIQDYDNDGWPDLSVSVVKFAGGQPHPVIFRNLGVKDGLPKFHAAALEVNDFPTADDIEPKSSKLFFERTLRERKIIYAAPGPTADYDNDGRLDMFLPMWWPEARSLLLKNETPGGNWLDVTVHGGKQLSSTGIGTRINVYPAGKLGDAKSMIGCREIATGFGYASGQPAIAHFGLGSVDLVDLQIVLPHGRGTLERKGVKANERMVIEQSIQTGD
jgi:hypothetical protein